MTTVTQTTTTTQANAKRMPRRVGTHAPAHVAALAQVRRDRMNVQLQAKGLPLLADVSWNSEAVR